MNKVYLLFTLLISAVPVIAQKKPIDHSVYDGWQSIGERAISNDGKFVVYAVNPQEGDGMLVVQAANNSYKKEIPRGYGAVISEDNRYIFFRIKPFFKDSRDARIKKKKPTEMPKDSLGIIELGKDSIIKIPRVKSFKTPEKTAGWLAFHLDKALPEAPKAKPQPDSLTQLNNLTRMADSLIRVADSLKAKAGEAKKKGLNVLQQPKKENKSSVSKSEEEAIDEGTELVLRNTATKEEKRFKLVNEYYFSKNGNVLIVEISKKKDDTLSNAMILWVNLATGKTDTVMEKFNEAKNYALDEQGTQLAFVAERDSASKALVKWYKLWYFKPGMDSAQLRAHAKTAGIPAGMTISADYANNFSKDGSRLFIGLTPFRAPKDTTLVDFETARLDVWHYNDDYLQPQQLIQLQTELKRSYTAVVNEHAIVPLANEQCESVVLADEGNASFALGISTKGHRIMRQWEGSNVGDYYWVNVADGTRKLIAEKIRQSFGTAVSPKGKFVVWYDWKKRHWLTWNAATGKTSVITAAIKVPLFDEEDDHPDYPPPHGIMGWHENDQYVYIYDRYDIWQCDPTSVVPAVCITNGLGRLNKMSIRNIDLDPDARSVKNNEWLLFKLKNEKEKGTGWKVHRLGTAFAFNDVEAATFPVEMNAPLRAKNSNDLLYLKMSPSVSANLYATQLEKMSSLQEATQLSAINPQQNTYWWHTVELRRWKMLDGKMSEGLLFKPENFDSTKKYPLILSFYERDADTRYNYRSPAPSASTVSISYFTSNGYLIFVPDIHYKDGEPGESAVNSVVSAANYLKKMKWVDSTKMAIQGQSWGGYQVAYLITRTKLFAAAGAGAPVANMTSAYGGIRWSSGLNRQFQYERSQSRIGATLWQRRDLYIKNSPLFHADKITTPLLITHNDKDGAVPWYQGIELFTAMRRLGKKVWLLQYNEEDHNLVERRNRKDLSIRLAQFFDYYLKGAPAPKWMTEGVPATLKGIDWGLKTNNER
jgi:dienelactone hydrolase